MLSKKSADDIFKILFLFFPQKIGFTSLATNGKDRCAIGYIEIGSVERKNNKINHKCAIGSVERKKKVNP